ncbi:MAG: TonB-dependent receptor plug domain-containing protein, partial [Candidatus Margulisbacteria bacterium]|nr:TonB-dependent receptor plug domain-containing protein [Candidatus Margulisiibacteriota bacterium]
MRIIFAVSLILVFAFGSFAEEMVITNESITTNVEENVIAEEVVSADVAEEVLVTAEVVEEIVTESIELEEEKIEPVEEKVFQETPQKPYTAKITVIGKRLPDYEGIDPVKATYKVYVGDTQDLEKRSVKTVSEVLEQTEGLYRNNNTGSEADMVLGIRGFTLGEELSVFVDCVRYNEADANNIYWYYIPMENIERYELLKGADSSVYWHGGFGGTVHFYRKKAFQPFVKIETGGLGYGSQAVGLSWEKWNLFGNMVIDHKAASGFRRFDDYDLSNIDLNQGFYLSSDKSRSVELGYQKAAGFTNYAGELTEDEMADNRYQAKAGDRNKTNAEFRTIRYKDKIFENLSVKINYTDFWRKMTYSSVTRPGFLNAITRQKLMTRQNGYNLATEFDWQTDCKLADVNITYGFEENVSNIL